MHYAVTVTVGWFPRENPCPRSLWTPGNSPQTGFPSCGPGRVGSEQPSGGHRSPASLELPRCPTPQPVLLTCESEPRALDGEEKKL
uniref:Uncharacterized protein n=1 Tax=Mus musculus TaxID=10090 RepID=Q3UNB7_MOUSE|nr:unnamed protein product [Mus musculus]